MTSKQYEELCRFFVAEQLKLPLSCVRSLHVANPERPPELWHTNLGPYRHQIDLYWETPGQTTSYLNIANAKWHQEGDKVGLKDVLLLQQVRSKIAAHKALLITNTVVEDVIKENGQVVGVRVHRPSSLVRSSVSPAW